MRQCKIQVQWYGDVLCVGNSRIPLRVHTLLGCNDHLGGGGSQRTSMYDSTEKGDTEGLMR